MTDEQLQSIKEFQQKAIRVENGFTHVNLDYCEAVAKDVPLLLKEIERLQAFEKQAVYTIRENGILRNQLIKEENLSKTRWESFVNCLHNEVKVSEENKRLRETLQFYADETNYQNISFSEPYSKVSSDYGTKARAALGDE